MRSLIDLVSALATYGGLLHFGKSAFMSCFHTIRFSYEGFTIYVHYYSSLFNGRIHTNIHLFIHVFQSLFFSLFFLCMLMRLLSSKIYFLCFFLESLHIALIYYFYMVSELQGWSISTKRFQSLIPLWRRACLAYKIFSYFCFAGCREFLLECIKSEIWILPQL